MKLIKYENYQIIPADELFLVKPFRDLFYADPSPTKEGFMQQLSYIYFMVDPLSPYHSIPDEQMRRSQVLAQEDLPSDYQPSEEMLLAMKIYENLTTTTTKRLLESMRRAIQKISEFLDNVNLYAVDDKGRRIDSVTSIVGATDKIPGLAKKLIETEKIVASEIEEAGRARGGNESKKMFEDGFGQLFG